MNTLKSRIANFSIGILLASFASTALAKSPAQAWIALTLEHEGTWVSFDPLTIESGSIFIGDPSWSDDYHLNGAKSLPNGSYSLWAFQDDDQHNLAIWIEVTGNKPAKKHTYIEFGTDGGTLGLGDYDAGVTLAELDGEVRDEWYFDGVVGKQARIETKWYPLPTSESIFIAELRNDGGYQAVLLGDEDNEVSGILIDLVGRKSDGEWIDTQLPEQ